MDKTCFKCQRKLPRTEFYKHKAMGDGLLGKCKECTKLDVRTHYSATREQRYAYEHSRFQKPERKASLRMYSERRKQTCPEKRAAHTAVYSAIRNGSLIRKPCEVCGDTQSQGHHDDYSKPLDVRWLCFVHHREVHGQVVVSRFRARQRNQ